MKKIILGLCAVLALNGTQAIASRIRDYEQPQRMAKTPYLASVWKKIPTYYTKPLVGDVPPQAANTNRKATNQAPTDNEETVTTQNTTK